MRAFRAWTTTVLLAVSVLALPAAALASAPTAPYTAITFDGTNPSVPDGAVAFDPGNATFNAGNNAGGAPTAKDGIFVYADVNPDPGGNGAGSIGIVPGGGATLATGTYPVVNLGTTVPSGDVGVFATYGHSSLCLTGASLVISEATADGSGNLTAFAASLTMACGSTAHAEIRWHSTVPYNAASITTGIWDFGLQYVGGGGQPATFTVRNAGVGSLVLGAAALTGARTSFAITAGQDHCSGTTLASGATCTIAVSPTPTTRWDGVSSPAVARLSIPDNLPTGSVSWELRVLGGTYRSAYAPLAIEAGPGEVTLSWPQLPHDPNWPLADNYVVRRLDLATPLLNGSGGSLTDTHVVPGREYFYTITSQSAGVDLYTTTPVGVVPWPRGGAGSFYPITTTRFLDTRQGIGAPRQRLAPGQTIHLKVEGRGPVPGSRISAVVLNLMAVHPAGSTSLTVYPRLGHRPPGPSLAAVSGHVTDDLVTVPVGYAGQVDITNGRAATDVIADVEGYYTADAAYVSRHGLGGQYQPFEYPWRLLDTGHTRYGSLRGGYYYKLSLDQALASWAWPHTTAALISITTLGSSADGAIAAWDGNDSAPGYFPRTSSLNYRPGVTTQNLAVVPVSQVYTNRDFAYVPTIGVLNAGRTPVHLIVDLVGVYDDSTLQWGLRYHPLATPRRIFAHSLGARGTAVVNPGSSAGYYTGALTVNATAVQPSANTGLTMWARLKGLVQPRFGATQDPARLTTVSQLVPMVGVSNQMDLNNYAGSTAVTIDELGTFEAWPVAGDPGYPAAPSAVPARLDALRPGLAPGSAAGDRSSDRQPVASGAVP